MLYQDRVVLFFDLMGWRDRVDAISDIEGAEESLALSLKLFSVFKKVKLPDRHDKVFITSFSDNVVVSGPAEDYIVDAFIRGISQIQQGLLYAGLMVRGGMTYGKIYHDDDVVFGPALHRAYDMERSIAKFPRVLIDENIGLSEESSEVVERDGGLTYVNSFCRKLVEHGAHAYRTAQGVPEAVKALGVTEPLPQPPSTDVAYMIMDWMARHAVAGAPNDGVREKLEVLVATIARERER